MKSKSILLHTPEGVRDFLNEEYARKEALEKNMIQILKTYGYRGIQTPTYEFFDIFSKDKGSVSSREMFKFVDRFGNTLVLRPDITPSVARCAAKYYPDASFSQRVFYCGSTFTNNSDYQGRLKEHTQLGAELIGDETTDAEAEMIAMMADALLSCGLNDFQIELGDINFFKGLIADAAMEPDDIEELRELIEDKNVFAVEAFLKSIGLSEHRSAPILQMMELFGGKECLKEAAKLSDHPLCQQAVAHLEKVYRLLKVYGKEDHVSFDFGLIGKYQYYTGIIFRTFTYGTGTSIVNGGRYDQLLHQYGRDASAIGFAVSVDDLLSALRSQKISISVDMPQIILLYDRKQKEAAIRLAGQYRAAGEQIQMMKLYRENSPADYREYAKNNFFTELRYLDKNGTLTVWEKEEL